MYVAVKPLPAQLVEHVIIYFEEQLYSQALGLLYALAVNEYRGSSTTEKPFAYVPSPHILALLATLTVHPTLTTRANNPDKVAAADQSLVILQHINKLIGADGAHLDTAFAFADHHGAAGKRKLNKRQLAKAAEDAKHRGNDSQPQAQIVNVSLANESGLFVKAEDFWHLVGWAFNCSSKYARRWARWKLWLSFHLDVLEDDLESRLDHQQTPADGDEEALEGLRNALVVQYLQSIGAGASRTTRRRAMRAIFAHGAAKDLTEFPEVFRNELKEPKKAETVDEIRARSRVNLDEGNFGDYFDDDDDDDDDAITPGQSTRLNEPRSSRKKTKDLSPAEEENVSLDETPLDDETSSIEAWGGVSAFHLRHRVLVMLGKVAYYLPNDFMHLQEMLDIFTEFIRPLPIPIFATIMTPPTGPSKTSFSPELYSTLVQLLFGSLVGANKAPRLEYLAIPSHNIIQEKYLSGVAASVTPADNAKLSLLIEGMLRLMWTSPHGLDPSIGFKSDLEFGIEMRRAKASNLFSTSKKSRVRNEDDEANLWLASSEARLAVIGQTLGNPHSAD